MPNLSAGLHNCPFWMSPLTFWDTHTMFPGSVWQDVTEGEGASPIIASSYNRHKSRRQSIFYSTLLQLNHKI